MLNQYKTNIKFTKKKSNYLQKKTRATYKRFSTILKSINYQYTIPHFIKLNYHVGDVKQISDYTNQNYIYNNTSDIDIINLHKSFINLRLSLFSITEICKKNGKILSIFHSTNPKQHQYSKLLTKKIQHQFISTWYPGMLSNCKILRKQYNSPYPHITTYPNFIIFCCPARVKELQAERLNYNIPIAAIHSTAQRNYNFLYTMLFNTSTLESQMLLQQLICTSINIGFIKRLLSFTTTKIKFPRLDSNQRPRT